MNHKLYQQYLKEYTLKALEQAKDDVSLAADLLEEKRKPGLLTKDRTEKKAALERATKVFTESRQRSLYVVLKSLGFDDLAKEKI
jgi:hypothetical protein